MIDLLYKHPDMERVKIRKDIIYKVDDNNLLKLDVYYSNNIKLLNNTTVVLVHGSSPIENIKDIELYQSWGNVLAASGL